MSRSERGHIKPLTIGSFAAVKGFPVPRRHANAVITRLIFRHKPPSGNLIWPAYLDVATAKRDDGSRRNRASLSGKRIICGTVKTMIAIAGMVMCK